MAILRFSISKMSDRIQFFQETFLLVNISKKMVLRILFLALNNADIQFDAKSLTLKSYYAAKTLSTTR